MKKTNNKGFTLVELLAVIVVLAIILAIAIPSVLGVINNSKNGSFKSSARMMISSAKTVVASQFGVDISLYPATYYVPTKNIEMDFSGSTPYGSTWDETCSAVFVTARDSKIIYYVAIGTKDGGDNDRHLVCKEADIDEEECTIEMGALVCGTTPSLGKLTGLAADNGVKTGGTAKLPNIPD